MREGMDINNHSGPRITQFLTFLGMLQISIMLSCHLLVYKLVSIGGITLSASTILFPLTYFIADIIAEVYGYKVSRQLIWAAFVCMLIFDFISPFLASLPSPATWGHQSQYNAVLDKLPRIFFGDFIAINIGQFINVYGITKLKILTKGRFFILRSICATILGETIFTLLAFCVIFFNVSNMSTIFELMVVSYIFKVFCAVLFSYPALLLSNYLKEKEGIDSYDYNTNFNPFKLSIE